jgi:hypothetical protein
MFVSRPAHPSVRGQHPVLVGSQWRRMLRLLLAFALTLGTLPLQFASVAFAAGIVVTTTADTIDAAGTCPAVTLGSLPGPGGQISLREAVCAANTNAGLDTITFSINGTFALTGAANEDNGGAGDLDIKQSLSIQGNGAANTIINGSGIERIFDVFPSAASTFDISGMTVQNGDTRLTSFKEGSAIYLHNNVTSTFNAIQVSNNFSGANGAIENRGNLTINNSVLTGNQTIPASGNVVGGALHNAGTLTIDNTTISNNSVRGEGGGIATTTGAAVVVNITDSTISGNTASVTGGGLGNGGGISTTGNQGTINITNSTISGNHADNNGGGAYFITPGGGTGNAVLTNVTISNNTADNDNNGTGAGGGIAQNTAAVTLRNTIVAGNFNSITSVRDDISGAVVGASSFNLVGDGTGSSGITNGVNNNQIGSGASPVDPLLGSLVNNGGSTETHALLAGSPALDTGSNGFCPAADQRGVPRPGGGVCDKGSYELNDTTPPDTTITSNPTNPSNSSSATFTFTGSDNLTPAGSLTFQCQIDGGGFSACTSPRTYTGLADGSHTFQVRATDQSGNVDPTPASYTWIVDATAPNTTITANPTNPSASTTAGFSFTGNDGSGTGVASFQCQLDGGGFSPCTSPQTYTGLSQGSHTFEVRAVDVAGNQDPTPATYTWVIDTVAPDTTITGNPTNPSASTNATFSFSSSDPGGSGVASFQCQIDGGGFSACTSPQTYTALGDGSHTFQVRAIDASGNVDPTPASFTWVVDATGPDTTITANPANPTTSTAASFSFTGNDGSGTGVASFECQLDSGGFSTCTSPQTYTGLSDGSHTFQVRAVDAAGNADSTPASFTWIVDTTGPNTTITVNPTNPSNSTAAGFSFTGDDGSGSGVASFECQLDGAGFSSCTSPQSYTGLSQGSHTFQVRAIDAVGNPDSTPANFTWVIDTTEPDTSITANPTNPSASANASFSFTGSDPGGSGVAGFECQLDGGAFSTCTSPQTYTGLSDGSHTFQVRAVDAASNVDSTPASFTWVVDATEPDTTITANPTNPSASANASFSFTGNDGSGTGVASFQCQIDGGGFSACTSSQPYTGLSQGSHTFQVRAVDAAGNPDTTPASFTWVIDTVAPDTTLTATPTDPSANANASFSFTGSDPGGSGVAGFECQIDGGAFIACASPQTYTGLSDGSHTFQVRAVDAAGNLDGTPASFTWLIDTTGPDTTITATPPNPSASANASFSFTGNDGGGTGVVGFECQIDGGAFIACASPRTYTGLSDGSHTFQVRAVDAAGNGDSTPASFTWLIDTTPPPAPVVITPANGSSTNNTQPLVSGTAEANSTVTVFLDGVAAGTTTADAVGNWTFTPPSPLSDGSHTARARATDAVGNTSVDSNTNTFTVDTVAPDTTITASPANPSASANASFSFTGNDGSGSGVVGFECQLDGGAFSACTSPQTYTGLSDGSHTFQVRAIDAASNTDSTPASFTWVVDTTAPDTTITANPTNPSASANASFSFTGNDGSGTGVVGFECQLDGGGFSACTSPQTYTGLSEGSHTFQVRAVDIANNRDSTPASFTWVIDTVAPDTTITASPTNPSASANASFSFTGNDGSGSGVASFECQLDGGAFIACTSPQTYTGLSDGSHTFRVRAIDAAGNTDSTPASFTWVVDTTAPTVAFSSAAADPTNVSPIPVTVTFSENVTGFTAGDITTGNGTVNNFAGSGSSYTFDLVPSGQGLVTADIAAGVAQDVAGNANTVATQFGRTFDSVAPSVTINQAAGQADPTGTAPISFTVVFDEPVTGFGESAADVTITGTAGATTATVAGSGTTYNVAISGMTGTGTVVVTLPLGAAQDLATNASAASTSTDNSVDFDPVVPVATGIVRANPSPTSAASVQFTVTFAKAVTGVDASDFNFTTAGVTGPIVTGVTGSGTTWTVTVNTGSGDGTLRMDLVDDDTIVDGAGNALGGTGAGNGNFTGGQEYTIDKTVPNVASIVRASVDPTNAATVDFAITFSEIVTDVDTADFALTTTGVISAAVTAVTGSGTTWTVTVSSGSGSGTIRLDVVDNDTIVDVIGNQLGGTGTGNGNFTSGEVYQIDKTAPTASNLVTAAVTPGSSVYTFTVDYADNLALDSSSLGNGNVRVTGPNGFDQLASLVGASPSGNGTPRTAMYQISAPGGTWDSADNGVYNVAIVGNQVRDTAGNALAATPLGSFTIAAGYKMYLSLVLSSSGLPDLVVDQISATSTGIQVVIRNQGSAPVNDAFWVDVYINPTTAPTKVNQIWQALGAQGAVWGVTAGALPIVPGGTLTLTLGDAYYRSDLSNVPQSLSPGTRIFAQVDSANATTTYGAVLETHEQNGGTYNNISSVVVLAGLRLVPPTAIRTPGAQPQEQLPAREP